MPSQFPWTSLTEVDKENAEGEIEMPANQIQDLSLSADIEKESQNLTFHDIVHAADKNEITMPKQ